MNEECGISLVRRLEIILEGSEVNSLEWLCAGMYYEILCWGYGYR